MNFWSCLVLWTLPNPADLNLLYQGVAFGSKLRIEVYDTTKTTWRLERHSQVTLPSRPTWLECKPKSWWPDWTRCVRPAGTPCWRPGPGYLRRPRWSHARHPRPEKASYSRINRWARLVGSRPTVLKWLGSELSSQTAMILKQIWFKLVNDVLAVKLKQSFLVTSIKAKA